MSANPLELFTAYPGTSNSSKESPDRRMRPRICVHWPVLLFRDMGETVASMTQDLSSSGFFCITSVPFIIGESLTCALRVPFHDPSGKHLDRNLECKVRVVRVEPQGVEGSFGVACRIEDYHFAELILRRYC